MKTVVCSKTTRRIAAMALCLSATAFAAQAQTITRAVSSRNVINNRPTGVTSTFTQKDRTVHVFLVFAKPFKCNMKAEWHAVKAEGLTPNQKVSEMGMKTDRYSTAHFSLSNTNPWPVGTYRVDVFANGKKIRAVSFAVK